MNRRITKLNCKTVSLQMIIFPVALTQSVNETVDACVRREDADVCQRYREKPLILFSRTDGPVGLKPKKAGK